MKNKECKHLRIEKMGGDVSDTWPELNGRLPIWYECLDCGTIWNTEEDLKNNKPQGEYKG